MISDFKKKKKTMISNFYIIEGAFGSWQGNRIESRKETRIKKMNDVDAFGCDPEIE